MRNENIGEARSVTANIRGNCDCRHEKAEPLKIFKIFSACQESLGQFLDMHVRASPLLDIGGTGLRPNWFCLFLA